MTPNARITLVKMSAMSKVICVAEGWVGQDAAKRLAISVCVSGSEGKGIKVGSMCIAPI